MKTKLPPKDYDLTTTLFTEPGFVPPKAKTTQLRELREGYKRGEVVARLQQRGLFLVRSLMLGAEQTDDQVAKGFARKYAAVSMLGSAWHSFAEERTGTLEEGFEGTRRRLKSFDFTRIPVQLRPDTDQMHSTGTERIGDCIGHTTGVIDAVREGYTSDIEAQQIKAGRCIGNTALHIFAAPVGDVVVNSPHLSSLAIQTLVRNQDKLLRVESLRLSDELGMVASLGALADHAGNPLTARVYAEIPQPLADTYERMQAAIPVV